jgi:DNA polymerase-3 subunit gamma/tau
VAHQSLYRKYRPQTFGDVVGQEHIERTLKNAVAEGSVAHAYLFCGPRGTGKTTTARILAKALDCQLGPTGEPDGTCSDCVEIAEGRHPDVHELDAASRTGVDNVREEIIGRVAFAPTRGRYKVYIIDEVHMLSAAAFNALLKTLEEPPSHVIFVMATTHPHKVPETIQSRCQRFDFRRISVDDIAGRLRIIADGEGIEVPDAALTLMARHAGGGMRDAITTLEQLAAFTENRIALGDVEGLLGEVDSAALFEIAGLVARRDVAGCFRWVARFAEEGTDLAEFVRELTGHVRNLYVLAAVDDARGVVDAGAEEIARFTSQAAEFGGSDRLAHVLDLLGELASELRWSSDQRLSLEVALTRMARPQGDLTIGGLAARVEALEVGTAAGALTAGALRSGSSAGALAPSAPTQPAESSLRAPAVSDTQQGQPAGSLQGTTAEPQAGSVQTSDAIASDVEPAATDPVVVELHHAGGLSRGSARGAWPAVVAEIRKIKPGRAQLFGSADVDVDIDGETLVVEFPADQSFAVQLAEEPEARALLQRALASALGYAPPVRYQLGKGAVRTAEPPVAALEPTPSTPPEASPPAAPPPREADDDGPIPEYYETGAGFSEPSVGHAHGGHAPKTPDPVAGGTDDIARLLTEHLGAQIVAEHAAQPVSANADEDAAEELAELDSAAGAVHNGQAVFDTDSGEDD